MEIKDTIYKVEEEFCSESMTFSEILVELIMEKVRTSEEHVATNLVTKETVEH